MGPIALKSVRDAKSLFGVFVMAFVWPAVEASLALAQVTTAITPTMGDGNLGTIVSSTGNTVRITGGTRPDNGTSLFHSFDQFDLGRTDTAQFLNTTPSFATHNILGRVTGGNPSSIFGTIDAMSYPQANLFLMNPAGIIFGPNATLSIGGSVAFTTADYLRLSETDGSNAGSFHADTTTTSLLTSASVAAFGFLGSHPAAIAVQGSTLEMHPGKSISLVGGNQGFTYADPGTGSMISVPNGVSMAGTKLSVQNGQMNIASLASPGEIKAGTLAYAPNGDGQSFGLLGTVNVSEHSIIDVSGQGGGSILIRGGRLVVDNSKISANTVGSDKGPYAGPFGEGIDIHVAQNAIIGNGTIIEANAIGKVAADSGYGGVRIAADHIEISGGPEVFAILETNPESPPFAGIRSNVEAGSTAGRSRDISLRATSILIKDAGQIKTATASSGNAGHIILEASGNIDTDFASITSESEISSGHAGNITLSSSQGNVSLANTTFVSSQAGTNSSGNTGNIVIKAPTGKIIISDGTMVFNSANGTGTLGGIQITANNLLLDNNSFIGGNNFGSNVAENIVITLDSHFTIAGNSAITTEALGPATAADIIIKAGDIVITGKSLLISGTGTTLTSTGSGGAIKLSAQSLTMTDGAIITASSTDTSPNPGEAGNILINAGQSLEMHDSSITTEATHASGGNIDIRAIDRVRLVNSTISTSVRGDAGSGGNIFIDPKVVILEGSNVTAKAVGGPGGNITFVTPLFLADPASLMSASSERGPSGTVTIQSPTSNLSGTVGQLASKTNPPQVLLQNRCIALAGGEQSTFILAGRDALPSEPGGWLSSPVAMEHWTGEETEEHVSGLMVRSYGWDNQPLLVMSKDETTVLSLRRLTPPGFLVRSFAVSAATGCSS
jgi:filamentous hemagglutinin family protein